MQPNTLLYNPDESQGWPLNHALIEIEFIAVKPAIRFTTHAWHLHLLLLSWYWLAENW